MGPIRRRGARERGAFATEQNRVLERGPPGRVLPGQRPGLCSRTGRWDWFQWGPIRSITSHVRGPPPQNRRMMANDGAGWVPMTEGRGCYEGVARRVGRRVFSSRQVSWKGLRGAAWGRARYEGHPIGAGGLVGPFRGQAPTGRQRVLVSGHPHIGHPRHHQ